MAETDQSDTDEQEQSVNVVGAKTIDWEQVRNAILDYTHEEHESFDPTTFHPSQVGYSKWKMYVEKLDLTTDHGHDLLGTFKTGTLIHEWFEDYGPDAVKEVVDGSNIVVEQGITVESPPRYDVTFQGTFDAYDYINDVVYDLKTRGGWYNFEPPNERHLDQLTIYAAGLDALYMSVVYISKKDMEIRQYPNAEDMDLSDTLMLDNGTGEAVLFDDERFANLCEKAQEVADAIAEMPDPDHVDDIPFEPTGSYFDKQTSLDPLQLGGVES